MSHKLNKKTLLRVILATVALFVFSNPGWSQIVGKWKTIDDETHEAKSIVQIWKAEDGMYYGKIMKIFNEAKKDDICDKCDPKDSRYKQKVLGMKIIMKMKKTGDNEYTEGTILDPNNGKVYRCKLFREGTNLAVRGYIAFLYRTQTWLPAE
jgi:uncharacterized protein (DUF2147 family)